jgi:hypothetical protein
LNFNDWFYLMGHELGNVMQAQDRGLLLYQGAGIFNNTLFEREAGSISGAFCYNFSPRGC